MFFRLDYDFLGVVDLVDHQPETPILSMYDYDIDGAVAFRRATGISCQFQLAAEIQQGQQTSSQPVHRRTMN